MLVAWTSDAAYSLLHAVGWCDRGHGLPGSDSGRPVWLGVTCHRGEQQIIAKAEMQAAACERGGQDGGAGRRPEAATKQKCRAARQLHADDLGLS